MLQLNINGIKGKLGELENFLHSNNIAIAALQETKLQPKSKDPTITGYCSIRKDRDKNGGGLMFIIRDDIPFQLSDPLDLNNNNIEQQNITISTNNNDNLEIINLYYPPASSTTDPRLINLSPLLNNDNKHRLIIGDLNAHHTLWHSTITDTRGNLIADTIQDSPFIVLNEDTHTRIPTNGQPTSPDISIISQDLATISTWTTHTTLSSDHIPIIIQIENNNNNSQPGNRTYINFNKANWSAFSAECDELIRQHNPPRSVEEGEKNIRHAINTAAKHHIPVGMRKNAVPCLTADILATIKQRDELRQANPTSEQIAVLNQQISTQTAQERRARWNSKIEKIANSPNTTTNLFKTLKSLTTANRPPRNIGISFNRKLYSTKRTIANQFNRQFTTPKLHTTNNRNRKITRTSKQLSNKFAPQFYPSEVRAAIKKSKSPTAAGPDSITTLHLKNLGDHAITYIPETINLSLRTTTIPNKWREGRILPLAKPGKPATEGTSYRPITLLSPIAKVMERLLLPLAEQHLQPHPCQHGFRKMHSTTTAMATISNAICTGFNQPNPQRTLLLAVDLSKAFDTVNITKLTEKIQQSTLPPSIIKWLAAYLRGRFCKTVYNGQTSSGRKVHFGVPQGGVLSPLLFNTYIADIPPPPPGIEIVCYADDLSLFATGSNITTLTRLLNSYTPDLFRFFQQLELNISPSKSTTTLFSPATREHNRKPRIVINGTAVPVCKNPTILGFTLDPGLSYNQHISNTVAATASRLQALKVVESQDWINTNTLRTTYKAIIRSKLEYGCPVWSANTAKSNVQRLQRVQNAGLRIVTGCHRSTPEDHLHQETNILPTQHHTDLRAAQFLAAAAHQEGHPCHHLALQQNRPRPKKETLYSKYNNDLQIAINDIITKNNNTATPSYKEVLSQLHTNTVNKAKNSYRDNTVLGKRPPTLHPTADTLPRKLQKLGAQLRCGHSSFLQHYKNRIDPTTTDRCPQCDTAADTTKHIFECARLGIQGKVEDLWTSPTIVEEIMKSRNNAR